MNRSKMWSFVLAVLAAGYAPRAEAVSATGGTVTNYTLGRTHFAAHIFTATVTTNLHVVRGGNAEVLVVAGGGGGGMFGGGGGAGGIVYSNEFPLVAGSNYVVTVGGGGWGDADVGGTGGSGTNSSFGAIVAYGGGGGGSRDDVVSYQDGVKGAGGGCGGGGSPADRYGGAGGVATNSGAQGRNGGDAGINLGGGGGGAGAAGGAPDGRTAGKGGDGLAFNLRRGTEEYYAGGGGGCAHQGTAGAGGTGGGGAGSSTGNGVAGENGLGGGGGGGYLGSAGGQGGSGVVIVRYVALTGIANAPVTDVKTGGATFNSWLVNTGALATTVYVLWGEENGAATGAWSHTNQWREGAWKNDTRPATNISLTPDRMYYYTFGVADARTSVVAGDPVSFLAGEVGVRTSWRESSEDKPADFVIFRPATATNGALAVNFALGGTGSSGRDYDPLESPVVIPAGASEVRLPVVPNFRFGDRLPKSVTLTIAPGRYAIGMQSNATILTRAPKEQ